MFDPIKIQQYTTYTSPNTNIKLGDQCIIGITDVLCHQDVVLALIDSYPNDIGIVINCQKIKNLLRVVAIRLTDYQKCLSKI